MKHVNCCAVRLDHESHVCLEYFRGTKMSEYLAFEPQGPEKFKEPTEKMEARFYRPASPLVTPEGAALSFLRAAQGAYLPGDGVTEIILEIYIMAKTKGSGNLKDLDVKELLTVYNDLAATLKRDKLKGWKEGKTRLIAKIEVLQAEVIRPSKAQAEAKQKQSDAASKRFAALPKKTGAASGPKKTAKNSKSAVVKPGVAKKQGIGVFCTDLIRAGKSNEEVLAAVKEKFPNAATSASSVAWYRNKVKDE